MEKKSTEGVSVKEIESFAKKHRFEVFFCLLFILALLFNFIFSSYGWALTSAMVGGAIGALFSSRVELFSRKMFHFVFKQEQTTQLVLAAAALGIAIFLSPLIFLLVGLHGGKSLHHMALESRGHTE